MKLWAKFIYGTGEQGEEGFILAGQPNFDPATLGFTFAHDALEHAPDGGHNDDGMANELLALGALLYGRGQARVFDASPGTVLRDELYGHAGACYFRLATPPYRIPALRSEAVEGWIQDGIKSARECIESEWEGWADREEDDRQEHLEHTLEDMATWLRIGFCRAKRRYQGASARDVASLHRKVAQDFDALRVRLSAKRGYGLPGDHGDELRLWLDPKTLDSRLELLRAEDLMP